MDLFGVTLDASGRGGAAHFLDVRTTEGESLLGRRIGRYQILRRLGAGSMGVVYAAHDPGLDRVVAIKLLPPTDIDIGHHETRLRREAQALARVDHPNVVAVHDIGIDAAGFYVVMRLVDGVTLAERMTDRRTKRRRLLAMFLDAGRGLIAAHDSEIVHRDFKPSNVLVGHDDRVFVGDFGLACSGDELAPYANEPILAVGSSPRLRLSALYQELTSQGGIVGTPYYMSPEQHRGEPATPRSDQFAFAVSLWIALFRRHPFGAHSHEAAMALARMREDRVILPARSKLIPSHLVKALVRGLRHDPAERWPSMRELVAELEPRRFRWPWS
ncbi:MAG TPA: serine/threonine-protein kinase [Kofleriaceae bacterium]|nr:serine/threonine-protein kinase [Kofleriaceae bacterium]